jgi:predicted O-methyltransferase YrrM
MILSDIERLKEISLENKIPIITDEVRDYIISILKDKKCSVLEIGGAIGYSSFCMSIYADSILTIEKDHDRFQKMLKYKTEFNPQSHYCINADALECEINSKFDLIFFDAAKSKNIEYFNKFSKLLNEGGVILTDNMFFHNLKSENVSKNTKKLLQKIQKYIQFLDDNQLFVTQILPIGDGLAVSKKRTN